MEEILLGKCLAAGICLMFILFNQPEYIRCMSVSQDARELMEDSNKWLPIRSFKTSEYSSDRQNSDSTRIFKLLNDEISSDNTQQVSAKNSTQAIASSTPLAASESKPKSRTSDKDENQLVESASVLNEVNAPMSRDNGRVGMLEMNDYGENGDDSGDEDEQSGIETRGRERLGGNESQELPQYPFDSTGRSIDQNENENSNNQNDGSRLLSSADESQSVNPQSEELSEAEAADKSALDEQQQQQREIIMAQARSEAKAIKEQQESLLRQQKLQQQMVLRRQDFNRNLTDSYLRGDEANGVVGKRFGGAKRTRERLPSRRVKNSDILFSDHPNHHDKPQVWNEENSKEMADYSALHPALSLVKLDGGLDLESAAQHHHGSHYGHSPGYHGDYFQFAESHKKGQYDSGFKRGNKKFHIAGHASQHKSHAEGHVKWHGKKGKGSHYWDLKHKNKKGYGHGHGHGYEYGYY